MAETARILIADDEANFRHSTADLLRDRGYACDAVADAEQALAALTAHAYDLLIADVRMPGNPHLELLHGLESAGSSMPVIVVTAYPTLESALDAWRLPVVAYLVKPFEFAALIHHVERGVQWSRVSRAVGSTRGRLEQWKHELGGLESGLRSDSPETRQGSINAFLDVTLRNIAGGLADIQRIAQAASGHDVAPGACQLLNCPRHSRLVQAVTNAVVVLERTKNSFKSRELGELRKQLEDVLKEERTG